MKTLYFNTNAETILYASIGDEVMWGMQPALVDYLLELLQRLEF